MAEGDADRSAVEFLGRHLLGRKAVPDERDWSIDQLLEFDRTVTRLSDLVAPSTTLQELHDFAGASFGWRYWEHLWRGVKVLFPDPQPQPGPTPPPPGAKWQDPIQLDQGQTGHCVGFGWAGWGDATPVEDQFHNADGHALYYEAKVIDGEPRAENGSSVRSGAKAMQQRGRLIAYAFTGQVEAVRNWLDAKSPIVFGTDWTNGMFTPDAQGFVAPTGDVAGGHCYLGLNDVPEAGAIECQNSWGQRWGKEGRFFLKYADVQKLLDAQGEACMALEQLL